MFLIALFLAITTVMVIFFSSWLRSFWPLPWPWSSCVLDCLLVAIVVVLLLCSRLPFPSHYLGPPLVFFGWVLFAINLVLIILLCSWLCSSWPLLWPWSSSCVPSDHRGHLFVLLVAFFLTIALVLVVLLFY